MSSLLWYINSLFPLPLDEVLPKTFLHYFLRLLLLLFPFRKKKKKCSEKLWPVLLVLFQPPILIAGEPIFCCWFGFLTYTTKLLVSISSLRKCSVNLISFYTANGIANIPGQKINGCIIFMSYLSQMINSFVLIMHLGTNSDVFFVSTNFKHV